jgi:hypothetical protein
MDLSARDRASRYSAPMRTIITTITLSLAITLSCGDDAPKRPDDGTVETWEACRWDGEVEPSLCDADLECTVQGVCAPQCMVANDCPTFDGFENECKAPGVCVPRCNAANECPKTGGVELVCSASKTCVGKPS